MPCNGRVSDLCCTCTWPARAYRTTMAPIRTPQLSGPIINLRYGCLAVIQVAAYLKPVRILSLFPRLRLRGWAAWPV